MLGTFNYFLNTASPKDIIEILSNLAVIIASVSATIFAYYGYELWKKQKVSEMKSSAALKYLKSLLSLRDEIKNFRNPFVPVDEMITSLKEEGIELKESDDISQKSQRPVYARRWKRINEKLTIMQENSYECEIFFNQEFVNRHEQLHEKVRTLFIHIKQYLDKSNWSKDYEKIEAVIWEYDNEFTKELTTFYEDSKIYFNKFITLTD